MMEFSLEYLEDFSSLYEKEEKRLMDIDDMLVEDKKR